MFLMYEHFAAFSCDSPTILDAVPSAELMVFLSLVVRFILVPVSPGDKQTQEDKHWWNCPQQDTECTVGDLQQSWSNQHEQSDKSNPYDSQRELGVRVLDSVGDGET